MSFAAFHAPSPVGSHPGASLAQVLRPFALIAALAFLAGFGGYLILGPPNVMGMVSGPGPRSSFRIVSRNTGTSAARGRLELPEENLGAVA